MQLSILFIPFDAAIQHYHRNAKLGVMGYPVEHDAMGGHLAFGDRQVEAAGATFEFKGAQAPPPAITGAFLLQIIGQCCEQSIGDAGLRFGIQQSPAAVAARYPDVLFLSEQPGALEFPAVLDVPTSTGHQVQYVLLGSTGKLAVQRIFGYRKATIPGGNWGAAALTKRTPPWNVDENLLAIEYEFMGKRYRVAGLHLSAKNVGASEGVRQTSIAELVKFCQWPAHGIQFVLGDFNIDVHGGGVGGSIGVLPGSTVYMAQATHPTVGVQATEQYSSSNNQKHFMGHLAIDPQVRVTPGLSLPRSVGGLYFSDHPPIYVTVEFPN